MTTLSNAPLNTIGKALIEIGKALGKAIVAGVGLELARAATGHVKRIVGPKEKDDGDNDDDPSPAAKKPQKRAGIAVEAIDANADEIIRIRKENETLRAEVQALRDAVPSNPPRSAS